MAVIQEIRKKTKIVFLLEKVAMAYQEVSKYEMNKIREITLKNREFIEELLKVYAEAKRAFLFEVKEEGKTIPSPLKRRVVVFLSANARFYGGLVLEIWKKVKEFLEKEKGDLVVIGEVGKYLVQQSDFKDKFYYFNLDDEKAKEKEIKEIVNFLKDYAEIKVFHGKFKTILTQEIIFTDISGETKEEKGETFGYLFEPSGEAVLDFFKRELISAFFYQSFLEHKLSRHATRMVQMYKATKKAKEKREMLKKEERKLKWQLIDKKQQEVNILSQLWR